MLLDDTLIKETNASFSDITRDLDNAIWIRSKAREVDLFHEYDMAETLAEVMTTLRKRYHWAAVSSSNIIWNLTEGPVRVVQIPDPARYLRPSDPLPERYLTIVNPEIISTTGKYHVNSGEGCGSLGEAQIIVNRHSCITIKGYVLEEEKEREIRSYNPLLTAYMEHEIQHLDGVIIVDKGPVHHLFTRNEIHDTQQIGILGYMSSLFETARSDIANISGVRQTYFKTFDRIILIDKHHKPIPTLSFVLKHEGGKPYWDIHEDKMWAIYKKNNIRFDYGEPIVFEFPDTPLFRKSLENPPEIRSRYRFWEIPISADFKN